MPTPRVIYWFPTDLRLHDSPALKAALDLSPSVLYPIWTWDPHYVYRARVGSNRWQYLLDCQSDLSASITKLNSKSTTSHQQWLPNLSRTSKRSRSPILISTSVWTTFSPRKAARGHLPNHQRPPTVTDVLEAKLRRVRQAQLIRRAILAPSSAAPSHSAVRKSVAPVEEVDEDAH